MILAMLIGGPVFVALIRISINKGFLTGLFFALGVVISDSSFFVLSFLGISQLKDSNLVHEILGFGGGAFLIVFGISMIFKKEKPITVTNGIMQGSRIKSMVSGFLINTLNPSAFIFWIATVSTVSAQFSGKNNLVLWFFIGCVSMVFGTDVLKAFLAGKVKDLVTPKFMLWLHRVSGTILLIIGAQTLTVAVLKYVHSH